MNGSQACAYCSPAVMPTTGIGSAGRLARSLEKPFRAEELLRRVRKTLDEGREVSTDQ